MAVSLAALSCGKSESHTGGTTEGRQAASASQGAPTWRLLHPTTDGNPQFHDVWAGKGGVYVVGSAGTILRSDDRGKTWGALASGITTELYGIGGAGDLLLAVGASGTALRSTDAGESWSQSPTGTGQTLHAIHAAGPRRAYAVGAKGTALRSDDGGTSWTRLDAGTEADLYAVWAPNDSDVYAAGDRGTTLRSRNGGDTWSLQVAGTSNMFRDLAGSSANEVLAVGTTYTRAGDGLLVTIPADTFPDAVSWLHRMRSEGGVVFRTTDGGEQWESISNFAGMHDLFAIGRHGQTVLAAGAGGAIYAGERDEQQWYWKLARATNGPILYALANVKDDLYAVGEAGTILVARGAQALAAARRGTAYSLYDVWLDGAQQIVAVGAEGLVLASSDGGTTFRRAEVPATSHLPLTGVWGSPDGERFAVGIEGIVLRSADGTRWTVDAALEGGSALAIWGDGRGAVVAVGDGGKIARRTGPGNWIAVAGGGTQDLHDLDGVAGGPLVGVGAAGTVLRSEDVGASWAAVASGSDEDLRAVCAASERDFHAIGSRGTALRSSDGGRNWTSESSGLVAGTAIACAGSDVLIGGPEGVRRRRAGGTWSTILDGHPVAALAARGNDIVAVGPWGSVLRARLD